MKVTKEHRVILAELIVPLDNKTNRDNYRNGNYHSSDRTVDVNKRYRWDLLWASQNYNPAKYNEVLALFTEYNDDHIDTALRSIVKEL